MGIKRLHKALQGIRLLAKEDPTTSTQSQTQAIQTSSIFQALAVA